jgi:hypothetical protein
MSIYIDIFYIIYIYIIYVSFNFLYARNGYRLLVGKPDGRRPLGRPRCRWVDNITMEFVMWTGLLWLKIGTGGELL